MINTKTETMTRIAFIMHGRIRGKQQLRTSIEESSKGKYQVAIMETEHPGDSFPLAVMALDKGYTHLVSVGGDGSLNEVINGYMSVAAGWMEKARNKIRITTLPMGTGNDFARTIGAPSTLAGLFDSVDKDNCQQVDLGLASYTNVDGGPAKRFFINITDIGLGGVVVEKAHRYPAWPGKKFNYQRGIISTLLTYRHREVSIQADTFSEQGRMMSLIIAKGKYFGSGLGIAPDASPSDGQFSIVSLGQVSILDYFRHLKTIRQCERVVHPQVTYRTARMITIEGSSGQLPIDLDGDFAGYTPLDIRICPAAVRFLHAKGKERDH